MTLSHISNAMQALDVSHTKKQRPAPTRTPVAPDAFVPNALHRSHDGWMTVERKVGADWQTLGSVPARHVGGLFSLEAVAEACQVDSYFSLHGMFAPGQWRQKHTVPGLAPVRRNVNSVRWLTCCHVDLDAYRSGMDSHGAIAAIMRLVDAGTLPPPSLFTSSRGAWCVWVLHSEDDKSSPVRTYCEGDTNRTLSRWSKVQNALHAVCSAIGSDPAAKHCATVTRFPGSINSKNGRRVSYSIHVDHTGKPYSYDLPTLEQWLLPHMAPQQAKQAPARIKSTNTKRSRIALQGWHGRWHRLNEVLVQLRDMRGGWKVGTRSQALHYACQSQKALGATTATVQRVLAGHLATMEQPPRDKITIADAMRVWRSTKLPKNGGARHQTIADALDVSPAESGLLSTNRKKSFPHSQRFGAAVPAMPTLSNADRIDRRRAAVLAICTAGHGLASGAHVQQLLDAQGLGAALATVLQDMAAVGHPSPRRHRLKPQPTETQGLLTDGT